MRKWIGIKIKQGAGWILGVALILGVPSWAAWYSGFLQFGEIARLLLCLFILAICVFLYRMINSIVRPELPWARRTKSQLRGAGLVSAVAAMLIFLG